MDAGTIVAIGVAATASCCFGVSTILQALGTRHVSSGAGLSLRRLPSLLRRRAFTGGLLLDLVGFGCASYAVRSLPLFLVQAITCSSVGVTAFLAARLLRERLRPTERMALAGIVVGLTMLVAVAAPGPAHVASLAAELVIVGGFPVALALVWALDRWRRLPAAVLGALSGAAFGIAALAARVLDVPDRPFGFVGEPLVWGAAAFTGLGLLLLVIGLDRGLATAVSAASMSVETLLPAGVAVLLLGDGARPGWGAVAVAGFALSTVCATVLSLNRGRPVAVGVATAGSLADAVPVRGATTRDARVPASGPAADDVPGKAAAGPDAVPVPAGATVVARPSSIGFDRPAAARVAFPAADRPDRRRSVLA